MTNRRSRRTVLVARRWNTSSCSRWLQQQRSIQEHQTHNHESNYCDVTEIKHLRESCIWEMHKCKSACLADASYFSSLAYFARSLISCGVKVDSS